MNIIYTEDNIPLALLKNNDNEDNIPLALLKIKNNEDNIPLSIIRTKLQFQNKKHTLININNILLEKQLINKNWETKILNHKKKRRREQTIIHGDLY